jgi:glycine cleavage system H protein
MRPKEAKFTKTHEYAIVEGDIATFGISDFAIEHLSDLVFIELPEAGDEVTAGKQFGEVESVKAVAEIVAPLSGEIIERNEAVVEDLGVLSGDPFGEGWLIKVRISDPAELESLMSAEEYAKFLETEAEH